MIVSRCSYHLMSACLRSGHPTIAYHIGAAPFVELAIDPLQIRAHQVLLL